MCSCYLHNYNLYNWAFTYVRTYEYLCNPMPTATEAQLGKVARSRVEYATHSSPLILGQAISRILMRSKHLRACNWVQPDEEVAKKLHAHPFDIRYVLLFFLVFVFPLVGRGRRRQSSTFDKLHVTLAVSTNRSSWRMWHSDLLQWWRE